jgi:hypothetical protein
MELQLTAARLRLDKKCGKSGIPDNKKCSKAVRPSKVAAPAASGVRDNSKAAKAAAAVGLSVAGAVTLALIARGKYSNKGQSVAQVFQASSQQPANLSPRRLRQVEYLTNSSKLLSGTKPIGLLPSRSSAPRENELASLEAYTDGSRVLNYKLRRGEAEELTAEEMLHIKRIDSWMANSTPVPGRYWRGLRDGESAQKYLNAKVGDSFVDPGYASFSSDLRAAKTFTSETHIDGGGFTNVLVRARGSMYPIPYNNLVAREVRVAQRRGQKPITGEHDFSYEAERLANRNSKFKVTKVIRNVKFSGDKYRTYTIIDVEMSSAPETRIKPGSGRRKPIRRSRYRTTPDTDLYPSVDDDNEWED